MWPGSPQTALIFVGLPLLTALVLLAAPLHDAAPLPPREETVAVTGSDMREPDLAVPEQLTVVAALPRAIVRRPARETAVPAVIYETRRTFHRSGERAHAVTSGVDAITVAPARASSRAGASLSMPAASLGTQSP